MNYTQKYMRPGPCKCSDLQTYGIKLAFRGQSYYKMAQQVVWQAGSNAPMYHHHYRWHQQVTAEAKRKKIQPTAEKTKIFLEIILRINVCDDTSLIGEL